jgi:quinolinate synthase
VKNLKSKNIFFIPDGNLGRYVKEQVSDKNIILNDGYCPIHAAISKEDVQKAKELHKGAKFLVHPECTNDIISLADFVGSTKDIIDFSVSDDCNEYIIGTETGVFYELVKKNPDKKFYPVKENQICPDMKLITLDKVYDVLKNETNEITLNKKMCKSAQKPLDLMLEIAK